MLEDLAADLHAKGLKVSDVEEFVEQEYAWGLTAERPPNGRPGAGVVVNVVIAESEARGGPHHGRMTFALDAVAYDGTVVDRMTSERDARAKSEAEVGEVWRQFAGRWNRGRLVKRITQHLR